MAAPMAQKGKINIRRPGHSSPATWSVPPVIASDDALTRWGHARVIMAVLPVAAPRLDGTERRGIMARGTHVPQATSMVCGREASARLQGVPDLPHAVSRLMASAVQRRRGAAPRALPEDQRQPGVAATSAHPKPLPSPTAIGLAASWTQAHQPPS